MDPILVAVIVFVLTFEGALARHPFPALLDSRLESAI